MGMQVIINSTAIPPLGHRGGKHGIKHASLEEQYGDMALGNACSRLRKGLSVHIARQILLA